MCHEIESTLHLESPLAATARAGGSHMCICYSLGAKGPLGIGQGTPKTTEGDPFKAPLISKWNRGSASAARCGDGPAAGTCTLLGGVRRLRVQATRSRGRISAQSQALPSEDDPDKEEEEKLWSDDDDERADDTWRLWTGR